MQYWCTLYTLHSALCTVLCAVDEYFFTRFYFHFQFSSLFYPFSRSISTYQEMKVPGYPVREVEQPANTNHKPQTTNHKPQTMHSHRVWSLNHPKWSLTNENGLEFFLSTNSDHNRKFNVSEDLLAELKLCSMFIKVWIFRSFFYDCIISFKISSFSILWDSFWYLSVETNS